MTDNNRLDEVNLQRIGMSFANIATLREIQKQVITSASLDTTEIEKFTFSQQGPDLPDTESIASQINILLDKSDVSDELRQAMELFNQLLMYVLSLVSSDDGPTNIHGILTVLLRAYIGGNASPSALLHLAAGQATAGHAPLKFTAGTLLSTPEAGTMEYQDGHFYLTDVQAARKAIALISNVVTSTTTVTNTVTETTIFTKTFAADELHGDMLISLFLTGSVTNASAVDDFTFNFKVGGSTVHTEARVGGNVTDVGWEICYQMTIRSTGAGGTFVDFARYLESGIADLANAEAGTHSVDTTGTVTLEVTITWANAKAGNTFSVTQGYLQYNH